MDEDGGPGWEMQQDNEARRFEEEQLKREAEAFDRLMARMWKTLRNNWRESCQK